MTAPVAAPLLAEAGDAVTLDIHGWLANGTTFLDERALRAQPLSQDPQDVRVPGSIKGYGAAELEVANRLHAGVVVRVGGPHGRGPPDSLLKPRAGLDPARRPHHRALAGRPLLAGFR